MEGAPTNPDPTPSIRTSNPTPLSLFLFSPRSIVSYPIPSPSAFHFLNPKDVVGVNVEYPISGVYDDDRSS